jgi:sulfur transfer protein SufE
MSTNKLEHYIDIISDINEYTKLIEWINTLSKEVEVDPAIRIPENYVYGCQVSTWISCVSKDNRLYFSFDSDSNIAKGIIRILLDVINGLTPNEIKQFSFYDFRKISSCLPTERQRTLQIILNKAHELANTTGDTQ